MSYILDALRRAEAERGRGAVPGIHTQALPTPGAPADRPGSANLVLVGAAGVAVAALAAGGTWWAMQRNADVPGAAAVVATAPPKPALPVPAPAPVVVAPAPAVAPAPVPAPVPSAPLASPPLAPATVEPRPVAQKRVAEAAREPSAAPSAAVRPREAQAAQRDPGPTTAAAAPPVAVAANSPVFAQNELPPSVREQLPVLQVTGATYSSNPAHRMAIVNGQVLQEGDQAAPGLKLERIEQGRTVWSFRGYRYAVAPQ